MPTKSAALEQVGKSRSTPKKQSRFLRYLPLYLMFLPGALYLFMNNYAPMSGLIIAFKKVNWRKGILGSDWVGLSNFTYLFKTKDAFNITRNTLLYNITFIILGTVIAITIAILLNEIRQKIYQKLCQTLIYVPYFFSWVLIFGIFYSLLGSYGIVNNIIASLGGSRVGFFSDQSVFRSVLVFTEGWKEIGYNTIIYLAAITGIDVTLYEAARMDGANKFKQIWHITMPGLLPTIVLMLIMKVGYILTTGFEQILVFYSPAVYDVADIIETYVYRIGMGQADFSLATALGLFNAVVAFVLIVGANTVSKKTLGRSIW